MLGNGATVTGVLICFTSHEGNIEVELLGFLREAPSRSALASSQSHKSALASSQGHERFEHPPPLIAIIAIVAIIDPSRSPAQLAPSRAQPARPVCPRGRQADYEVQSSEGHSCAVANRS